MQICIQIDISIKLKKKSKLQHCIAPPTALVTKCERLKINGYVVKPVKNIIADLIM